jgi:hypothetical protein
MDRPKDEYVEEERTIALETILSKPDARSNPRDHQGLESEL